MKTHKKKWKQGIAILLAGLMAISPLPFGKLGSVTAKAATVSEEVSVQGLNLANATETDVTETDVTESDVTETVSDNALEVNQQTADLPNETLTYVTGEGTAEKPYQIGSADALVEFAELMNAKTDGTSNAKIYAELTADITFNENVLKEDGTLNGTPEKEWTPIGKSISRMFIGEFDGKGHTISGLYCSAASFGFAGLFGYAGGGTIQNVGVVDSYLKGGDHSGGIVGYTYGQNGQEMLVQNCFSQCTVETYVNGGTTGGIAGTLQTRSTLKNCYTIGAGGKNVDLADEIIKATVTNSYCLSDTAVAGTGSTVPEKTAEEFASGAVTYLLNGNQDTITWYQNIDEGTKKDPYPVFQDAANSHKQVFESASESDPYMYFNAKPYYRATANGYIEKVYDGSGRDLSVENGADLKWEKDITAGSTEGSVDHIDYYVDQAGTKTNAENSGAAEEGKAPVNPGTYYAKVFVNGTGTTPVESRYIEFKVLPYEKPVQVENVYQIASANDLYWFAALVNGDQSIIGYTSQNILANAVLTGNIQVNTGEVAACNGINTGSWREWIPIGTYVYGGTFDGQGYVISGIYLNGDSDEAGLFGKIYYATIKNLGITNSYICGNKDIGGIVGYGSNSNIANCYISQSVVKGKDIVGGISGYLRGSTINNCYVSDTAVAGDVNVGGVGGMLYIGSIINTYFDQDKFNGEAVGYNIESKVEFVSGKASAAFSSGEVAYLLNASNVEGKHVWYQNLSGEDVDAIPVLQGDKVVYALTCQKADTSDKMLYGNENQTVTLPEATDGYVWMDRMEIKLSDQTSYTFGTSDAQIVEKKEQAALTLNGATVTYGNKLTLTTNGGSTNGAVTYQIVEGGTGAATITGNQLTPTKVGTVLVKATMAGNDTYLKIISNTASITIEKAPEPIIPAPEVGTKLQDAKGASYKVTTAGALNGTVEYAAPKNKSQKSVTIPATVTLDGITYEVTSVAANAFKNNKKLTKVTIGSNINKIGKQAFYGCKKLKSITIKTAKLTKKNVGSKAFKGIYAKATIKVPKKQLSSYKKILKAKGVSGSARIKK